MGNRRRKSTSSEVLTTKKTRVSRTKKKDEVEDVVRASLPVLSEEKLYADDNTVSTTENKVEDKVLRIVLPKIKIKCEPLNVEKIIDLGSTENVTDTGQKSLKTPTRKCRSTDSKKTKSLKPASNNKLEKVKKFSSETQLPKSLNGSRKKLQEAKETKVFVSVSSMKKIKIQDPPQKIRLKNLSTKPQLTLKNKSLLCSPVQETNNSKLTQQKNIEHSYQASSFQSLETQSSYNLNPGTSNIKESSYSSLWALDDESALTELNDINLEELTPTLENVSDKELKIKLREEMEERDTNITEALGLTNLFDNNNLTIIARDKNQWNHNQSNNGLESPNKNNLQAIVEAFMKNPQLNYLKENTALKKGLCFTWLSNNYMCSSEKCIYSHNAFSLFTKKLKQYPSKFIMIVVISMRNDILFVDVIMAAFKILSERKMPTVWVTFLIYFVFYVTEPSDSRFLKFWVNAARFFCQLDRKYAAANGFASLLSVFSHGEKSEEWKIIEFIKLIKQPPVQISTTYALLQPILKMDIPSQFLFEAIESCLVTKEDLPKVYSIIIPKISIMTSPIQVVELLLKFCKTLEDEHFQICADDLKRRLQPKVLSFKTKITHQKYPLTASFQKELSRHTNDSLVTASSIPEMNLETELVDVGVDNNYFELQQDFYNLVTETIKLLPDTIPSPFRNEIKTDTAVETYIKEEDICERQINRIRQFFQDCQFDLLGKYLNELKTTVIERAMEVILKLLFHMKISLQQVVDLVKIIVLPCKSENASKIIASVSVTLILNLVKINEWEKAHAIASLCKEKDINLVKGKVFYTEPDTITQSRIALLLIEIYAYKSDYRSAVDLLKQYSLHSSDSSLWKITSKPHDETIRVRILEDLLRQIIFSQTTDVAYDLFEIIWKSQNQLFGAVDLRKFVNEILILLLNQGNEDATNLYEKIKLEVQLNDTAARGILVTLVRQNRLSAAKSLLLSANQNVYFLPEVRLGSIDVMVSSIWLEEEIYATFDTLFDSLIAEKQNCISTDYDDLEVNIKIQKPNKVTDSSFRPLCLGIIKPFYKDACNRIHRVLQYQFNPPLKLIVKSPGLKLDEQTLRIHLEKRMNQNSC